MKRKCCLIFFSIWCVLLTACKPSQQEIDAQKRSESEAIQIAVAKATEAARLKAEEDERVRVAAEQARILQQSQECISNVLENDNAAGGNVYAMKSIDLMGCPIDFSQSYKLHIYAWEDMAKIDAALRSLNSDENVKETLIKGGLCALFDCPATPIKDAVEADTILRKKREEVNASISETYRAVEITALKYGVVLNKSG